MSEKKSAWTDADTEAMFATIGRYIVIFQWIEGKLDEILLLGWGHQNWEQSQVKLAKMTNSQKVKALGAIVSDSDEFARALHVQAPWGWIYGVSWMREPRDRVAYLSNCTMSALRRPVGQRPVERFHLHCITR